MADVSILVEVESAQVDLRIAALEKGLSGEGMVRFFSEVMGPFIKTRATRRFKGEGDDATKGKWAVLLPVTQSIRLSNPQWGVGASHPINVRTHDLENYITNSSFLAWPHALGASMSYPGKETGDPLLIKKVKTAQHGSPDPKTVARPVLVVSVLDEMFMQTSLIKHLFGMEGVVSYA